MNERNPLDLPIASSIETYLPDHQTKAVRDFFESQADTYSDFFSPKTKSGAAFLFQERLIRSVNLLRGSRGAMLDCASGTGDITDAVIKVCQFDRLTINDFSSRMIEHCRAMIDSNLPEGAITWKTEDVFCLLESTAAKSFDVILCLGLIAHCGQLPRLLHGLHELLRPDGTLLIQSSLLDHFGTRAIRLFASTRFRKSRYDIEFFYLTDLIRVAQHAGFEVVSVDRHGLCLPFGDRLFGSLNYRLEKVFRAKLSLNGGEALLLLRKLH